MSFGADDTGFWEALIMADTLDADGPMSGRLIPDGAVGNVFGPVPSLVREATGYVFHRKIFTGTQTPDTQIYYRAIAFIAQPPADPNTVVSLLEVRDWFDSWAEARDQFEAFLVKGPKWSARILEINPQGSKTLTIYQRESVELPQVGDVMVVVQNEGLPTELSQYVQIADVADQVREFTILRSNASISFTRRVVTLQLYDPLEATFNGGEPTDLDGAPAESILRSTTVANAAQFKSITTLAQPALAGESEIWISSIYAPIVPAVRDETALPLANPLRQASVLVASGQVIQLESAAELAAGDTWFLGTPVLPGSFELAFAGATLTDDKAGGVWSGATPVATLDYARGRLTLPATAPTYSGTKVLRFRAAAAPSYQVQTVAFEVQVTQGQVYTMILSPAAALGTLRFDYMAQEQWYTLLDAGNGVLTGSNQAYGSGQYIQAAAQVTATAGNLPDIGSWAIFSWATPIAAFNRAGQAPSRAYFLIQLAHPGAHPGSITITWDDGAPRTATDSLGLLTGDAEGPVHYAGSLILFSPLLLPPPGTAFAVTYQYGTDLSHTATVTPDGSGTVSLTLPDANLVPGSLSASWSVTGNAAQPWGSQSVNQSLSARDNGTGGWIGRTGTINYAAGEFTLNSDASISYQRQTVEQKPGGFVTLPSGNGSSYRQEYFQTVTSYTEATATAHLSGDLTIRYRVADTPGAATESFLGTNLILVLNAGFGESLIPDATRFRFGPSTFTETGGQIFRDLAVDTGSGILAGNADHAAGLVTLIDWPAGESSLPVIESLSTTVALNLVSDAVFRFSAGTIRPGSVQILAELVTGASINLFVDETGVIAAPNIGGKVSVDQGYAHLRFGNWVDPAGHEAEYWYHASNIRADGMIWKPEMAYGDTLRVTAVSYTYQPSSADRIGVNARRLPPNGLVPFVNRGDIGAVFEWGELVLPTPITPGASFSAGHDHLALIKVHDANGLTVAAGATTYNGDLVAGTITFSGTLNLSAYVQPLTFQWLLADRREVSAVDASGRVKLNKPLRNGFQAGAYFATALELGDLQARVPANTMFTQVSWNTGAPVWSDVRVGSEPAFQFDRYNFAIGVTNEGAITERWVCVLVSTTTYDCYSENMGKLNTTPLSINAEFAPINPATKTTSNPAGAPFFRIPADALSPGSVANAFRFNTVASKAGLRVFRTILPGPSDVVSDEFSVLILGDSDL